MDTAGRRGNPSQLETDVTECGGTWTPWRVVATYHSCLCIMMMMMFYWGFDVNFCLLLSYRMDRPLVLHCQWRSAYKPAHFHRPTTLNSSVLHPPSVIICLLSPHHSQNISSILAPGRGLLVSRRTVQMDLSGMQITAYLDNISNNNNLYGVSKNVQGTDRL